MISDLHLKEINYQLSENQFMCIFEPKELQGIYIIPHIKGYVIDLKRRDITIDIESPSFYRNFDSCKPLRLKGRLPDKEISLNSAIFDKIQWELIFEYHRSGGMGGSMERDSLKVTLKDTLS